MPAGAIVGETGAADRSTLDSAPDGSGPLTIDADATVKGNSYLLVKKDDNPEAADYPFDSYEFKPILDPQARVNAAISGEVDLANITSDTQAQVESAGTGLVANGGTVQNIVAFDKIGALGPQWADPRVYQALSMAIDRETYVSAVHPGEIPTANALPADNPGYLPELDEEYAYDPEGAKELLAEAGYPGRVRLRLHDQPGQPARPRGPAAVLGGDRRQREPARTRPRPKSCSRSCRPSRSAARSRSRGPTRSGNVFGVLFGFANFHGARERRDPGRRGCIRCSPGCR